MSYSTGFASAYDTVDTGAWTPGDPWPGTPGGANRPAWSPYIRFYLRAQIGAGTAFTFDDPAAGVLDAGNVLGPVETEGDLWVDLSCDAMDVTIHRGSSSAAGVLSKAEAGTLSAVLFDPTAKYDPLNPDTIYALHGQTRLTAGVRVEAFAETVDPATATVTRFDLFAGTADRWSEPWTTHLDERTAKLEASDDTKRLVRLNGSGVPDAPAGQVLNQRVGYVLAQMGWTGATLPPSNETVLRVWQLATLNQKNCWELLSRTISDELGFLYFTAAGKLRWTVREDWFSRPDPAVSIGCGTGLFDIATDVVPASHDTLLRNRVFASNTGGTQQTAQSDSSIAEYGEQSYQRTDLGLLSDVMASKWAQTLVQIGAFPRTTLDHVTMQPAVDPDPVASWPAVLGRMFITDLVRVLWEQAGYTSDVSCRIVGVEHKVSPDAWEVSWRTVDPAATMTAFTFHMGPSANDMLDSGFVLA